MTTTAPTKQIPNRWPYKYDADVLKGQLCAMFVWQGFINAKAKWSAVELNRYEGMVGASHEVATLSRLLSLELEEFLGKRKKEGGFAALREKFEHEGWPGVFEYEVADPYGAWLRKAKAWPSHAQARTKARAMVKAFFER